MRIRVMGPAAAFLLTGCLCFSVQTADATTATWTNFVAGTAVADTWTNAANWNAAQYPGQEAANQNAYLTNRVADTVYKAVVDTPLPNTVGTVEIKNLGAGGEAWVIVTNTVFAATNLLIRANGRVQIDSGGVVTNLLGFTMDGTNGQLLVNSGGSLYASNNVFAGSTSGGKSNVLSLGDSAFFAVTNGYLYLGSGAGSDANCLLVPGNNVRMRTTATCVLGSGSANNTALFTGTNAIWELGGNVQMRVGQSTGARSNTLTVAQGSLSLIGTGTLNIGLNAGAFYNALIVTNGGRLSTFATVGAGYTTSNNLILVTGAGSVWNGGGAQEKSGDTGNSSGNRLVVDDNGTVTNASVLVGTGNTIPSGNSLFLSNGAQWYVGSGTGSTVGNATSNNSAVVTGPTTLWNGNVQSLTVGTGATGFGNVMRIENGSLVTNVMGMTTGGSGGSSNTLVVTGGGRCVLSIGGSYAVGSGASGNFTFVSGKGSVLGSAGSLTNGNLFVGSTGATNNVMVVDGASSPGWAQLYVGRLGFSVGNTLTVTSNGHLQAGFVRVGHQGSNTWNNTLQVMDGGLLEVGQSGLQVGQATTGPAGNNSITNAGGVYQFTYAAPGIITAPSSNSFIYLTDGTIAFRGVTTVDVKGNRTGTLTNITYSGNNNGFRLNTATNAASPDQSYTFANTLGPTNYARLELLNGAFYRGGSVTIGSGGTLAVSGSPSTITNLTIASGGALEVTVSGTNSASRLNAVGSVALGGTLRLVLAAPPPPAGFDWTLISKSGAAGMTGQFAGGVIVKQLYQGTNYTFRIDTAGGDGNDLVLSSLGRSIEGTALLVF